MNRREIEKILHQYPIQDYTILSYGYISGSSHYRIRAKTETGRVSFVFRNCIEAYSSSPSEKQNDEADEPESLQSHSTSNQNAPREAESTGHQEFSEGDETEDQTLTAIEETQTGIATEEYEYGWFYIEHSNRAREWTLRLPLEFHEVQIQLRWISISLIFHKLVVKFEQPSSQIVKTG